MDRLLLTKYVHVQLVTDLPCFVFDLIIKYKLILFPTSIKGNGPYLRQYVFTWGRYETVNSLNFPIRE